MIKEAIDKILSLGAVQRFQIDGREYADQGLNPIKPPVQSDLDIMTLTAIEDYFRDNPDAIALDKVVVHVKSHRNVVVVSAVSDEWLQRHSYLDSKTAPESFQYGQYMSIEKFMIALQSYFIQDDTTAMLLALVGNITDDTSIKYLDDGVTQQVQAKTGIARIGDVPLPNPVVLAPYRTFLEVLQPSSQFVFRLKKGDSGPLAALFEADGGNWQLECVKLVRDWLRVHLPEGTTILA